MRKVLAFLLVACAAFAVGDRAFGWLADRILRHSGFRFARLYKGRPQADVVVFGNSRAVNGFYTPRLAERTGQRWLNLGYNGMDAALIEAVALDYLDRCAPPRAVVLEVSNIASADGSVRDCRLFAAYSRRLAVLDRRTSGAVGRAAPHLRTLAANGETLMRCAFYLGRDDQHWVNEGQLDPAQADRLRQEAGRRMEIEPLPESVACYARVIAALRRRGVPVYCVVTPYLLPPGEQARTQGWLDALRASVDEGVHLVNLVGGVSEPRLFADPSHLNRAGSLVLADRLVDTVFGPPTRSEEPAGGRAPR
jgi:hypothetical protein